MKRSLSVALFFAAVLPAAQAQPGPGMAMGGNNCLLQKLHEACPDMRDQDCMREHSGELTACRRPKKGEDAGQ